MSLRGVIRGRTIELDEPPPLPDGTRVEVKLHTPAAEDSLWGLLADHPELVESLRQIVHERTQQPWRTPDETSDTGH